MSRIRSIHPGIWTDDAFMSLSALARLLYIGLLNEAWDDGVFEWKPLTIKAKIFPADNVDVPALLDELCEADKIAERNDSKHYGIIRNFRDYQRPKKPNSSGLLQDEDREYVGLVPNQSGTDGEKSPQMEDGGGRMEDEDTPPPPVPEPEGARVSFEDVLEAYPRDPGPKTATAKKAFERIPEADRATVLAGAIYTSKALAADSAKRGRSVEEGAKWVTELHNFIANGEWRSAAALAARDQPSPDLAVVEADSPEFKALAKARGRTPFVGDSGRITVPKAELEKAMAAA
jgi:hypothetical protein